MRFRASKASTASGSGESVSSPESRSASSSMSAGAGATVEQSYPKFFGESAAGAKALKLLWVSAGSDDFALNGSKALDEVLTKNGVKHHFSIRPGYRHEWRQWRQDLWEFAPLLFQTSDKGTY